MRGSGAQDISRVAVMWGALLCGLFGALFLGHAIATGNLKLVKFAAIAIVAMVSVLFVGKNYWLLIPLTLYLQGQILILPLPFSVAELGVLYASGMFGLHYAMKRVTFHGRADWLDIVLWANIVYMLTVYIRHPVGLNRFGGDLIGGRPYAAVGVAVLAYIVLSTQKITPRQAKWLPIVISFPGILVGLISTFTFFVPALAPVLYQIYSDFDITAYTLQEFQGQTIEFGRSRIGSLGNVGSQLFRLLLCYFDPAKLISPLSIIPFTLFGFANIAILLSGFRASLALSWLSFALSCILRRRPAQIAVVAAAGLLLYAIAALGNGSIFTLPITFQRTLSFLPGNWDHEAMRDATGSTEWRIEMWKIAWNSPHYIQNKIFGQGFGFLASDLRFLQQTTAFGGQLQEQDTLAFFLIRGSFHSGPLSAIRVVGFVGMILFFILLGVISVQGYQILQKSRNTDYFPLCLWFSFVTLLFLPIYILVFGAYAEDFPRFIVFAGLLRLLKNSLLTPNPDQLDTQSGSAVTSTHETLTQPTQQQRLSPASRKLI